MSNITSIPAPRVPFIDDRTGLISREWYRFFLNLFVLTGSGTTDASWTDLQLTPSDQPVVVDVDAAGLGSVFPAYPMPSDDAYVSPTYEHPVPDNPVTPPYPELVLPDLLPPTNPVGFTQRVEGLSSDVQGLMLAPPIPTVTTAIRRGAIRKTATTQTIGTLGASFVAITGYDSSGFTAGSGVTVNLANGTLTPANAGDYVFIMNVSLQFDSSASTRFFAARVYDTTAAAALTDVAITPFVAPSLVGYTFSAVLPFTISPSQINHVLRLEIGSGSSFTTTTCPNATFAMFSLGLL